MSRRPVAERLVRHSDTRIVVLDDLKIAFLPIPKSGCTSLLWTLSELAGLSREGFDGSRQSEVTRPMAIHDMTRWKPEHRWQTKSEDERRAIVESDEWLRLTVVRDPAPRLWSGWQSKLLLAEPRFVERFGDLPWFPTDVTDADSLRAAFRSFVRALDIDPEEAPHDAHWGSQAGLMAGFSPTWVGRANEPGATLEVIRTHLAARGLDPDRVSSDVPRENANPIPFHPSVYDASTAASVARIFSDDYATWSFPPPADGTGSDDTAWQTLVDQRLLMVGELAERHRRIGELLAIVEERDRAAARNLKRAEKAEADLAAITGSRSWRATESLRRLRSKTR